MEHQQSSEPEERPTDAGPARVHIERPDGTPAYLLVCTHGSGGGVDAPDLLALRGAVVRAGSVAAAVEQPYRVAGRRAPGSAAAQDRAWCQVVSGLRQRFPDLPVVLAGRSNGARVVCRTAPETRPAAVVALAFPLHPPGRPERSRAPELRAAPGPTLVVNGERDPFGVPDPADAHTVHVLPGQRHDLARNPGGLASTVVDWIAERLI